MLSRSDTRAQVKRMSTTFWQVKHIIKVASQALGGLLQW